MKVALVRQRYQVGGGAERSVVNLASQLMKQGCEVHLFAHSWVEDNLRGVVFHRVPIITGTSFLKVLSFAFFSARLLRKERFDIVHSFERTLYHDIYRAGDGCHREWLLQRHGTFPGRRFADAISPLHHSILALERRIFTPSCSRRVIANSRKTKAEIIRHYGFPGDRIAVIYNGVDLDRFHPGNRERLGSGIRPRLGLAPDDFVLLFVGSGFGRKGLRFLILGAANVLSRRGDLPLKVVVAGKGDPQPYRALATRLGIEKRLHFVGVWAKIEELYATGAALVLPTLYDPFANATLEAMAAGLPVITTQTNGASELLADGLSGFVLKDARDPRELGMRILDLLDGERRAAMGSEARRMAERFPMTRQAQETLALYREVLDEKKDELCPSQSR